MKTPNVEVLSTNISYKLKERLNLAVGDKMIIIAGKCTAIFDGRIKSNLEDGERLLVIKKDLSILMHGPTGVKPLNWQKPNAGPITFQYEDERLVVFTKRKKTKEELTIIFSSLSSIILWHASDHIDIQIYGDESDLVKYLVSHPDLVDEGFHVAKTEYSTDVGPVDIRGFDNGGNEVIVEVKKRNASPADAHQLKRYIEYFEGTEKKKVRGILIAPEFPEKVSKYLTENGLEQRIIHWKEIFPTIKRVQESKLEDFFKK